MNPLLLYYWLIPIKNKNKTNTNHFFVNFLNP